VLAPDCGIARETSMEFPDRKLCIVDRNQLRGDAESGPQPVASLDDPFTIYRDSPNGDRAFELLR